MDEYIAAYISKNTTLQGQIGEEIAELMAKEINTTGDVLNIKINNSGHGFDVLSFTPNKQVPTSVRVLEAKPFTGTSVELPVTNNGVQMSEEWLRAKIKDMQFHSDPTIQQIGDNLQKLLKQNKLEKFVVTVDKDLKQVIIIKLDTF